MNVAPVNFNSRILKYKTNESEKMNYASVPNSNNNFDTFNLKSNKVSKNSVSFKGLEKGFANLSNYEGLGKMMDHFAYLEKCDPDKSKEIKTVKDFIVELNDTAKSKGQDICLVWRKWEKSEKFSFDNSYYVFTDKNYKKYFAKKNFSVCGPGTHLEKLIRDSDEVDSGKDHFDIDLCSFRFARENAPTGYDFTMKKFVKNTILADLRCPTNTTYNSSRGFGNFFERIESTCLSGMAEIIERHRSHA